jgi:CheY-like chemotaxis protein
MVRVLVVVMSRRFGRAAARVLPHAGHEAFCAESGAQAIRTLREHERDIALVDLGLPDLIAMSGSPENLSEAHARGYTHQLLKPVPLESLLAMIASVAEAHSNRSES